MHLLRNSGLRGLQPFACAQSTYLLKPAASLQQSHPFTTSPLTSSARSHPSTNALQRSYFTTTLPWISTRYASSTSNSTISSTSAANSAISSKPGEVALNWNEYLRLRRIRRYYNLGGSIIMSAGGLFTGAGVLASEDIAGWGQQMFGLDPFIIMGLWTTGCGGIGWLLGPVAGSAVFGLLYRGFGGSMRTKERDFFERIKKYRVDPTSSSMQNPVPDYYGEKITSVAGYRRWLKDQRAFNKKRQSFV